jgi:hypothetical protein
MAGRYPWREREKAIQLSQTLRLPLLVTLAGDANHALKDLLGITWQIVVTLLGAEKAVAAKTVARVEPFDYPANRSVEGDLASLLFSLAEPFAGGKKCPVQVHKLEKTFRRS